MELNYVHVFTTVADQYEFAIAKFIELAEQAIADHDYFAVAFSGGRTPLEFYQRLALYEKKIIWSKVHIFQVDERMGTENSEDNNFQQLEKNLLSKLTIPTANIHAISVDKSSTQTAIEDYLTELQQFFSLEAGEFPMFDLIMLGMGEDGHAASLFPGDKAILVQKKLLVAVNNKWVEHERITITLPLINNARNIIFLVNGANKSRALKEAIQQHNWALPAAKVAPQNGELLFLLTIMNDGEAASGL